MAPKATKSIVRQRNGSQTARDLGSANVGTRGIRTVTAPASRRGSMFASRKTGSQARHEARCGICSHSERLAIEKAFLHHQMSVADITRCYGVGHDAVYRHLRALNLLAARH